MGGFCNKNDIIGKKLFKLTVLSISKTTDKDKHTFYECQCECGKIRTIRRSSLIAGTTKTCGKCFISKDLSGQKFGQLQVIKFLKKEKEKVYWECLCECGKIKDTYTSLLMTGRMTHCGCNKKEMPYGYRHGNWHGFAEISQRYWKTLEKGAITRKLEFSINKKDTWNLFLKQNRKCALSGVELIFATNKLSDQTASLDRIDSSKGYTEDNVQWIHKDLQSMKMNQSEKDFIKWCKLIANHR